MLNITSGGTVETLLADGESEVVRRVMQIKTTSGATSDVDIDTIVRKDDGRTVAFAGIIRLRPTQPSSVDLTPLIRHVFELRRSLAILTDAGQVLIDMANDVTGELVIKAGTSIKHQAERLVVIVDELDADRKMLSS